MANDARKLVTLAELSGLFSQELQALDDTVGASVSVQYRLAAPDDEGVNWSSDFIVNAGPTAALVDVQARLRTLVPRARSMFNLRD
jgi:hypothetical protein